MATTDRALPNPRGQQQANIPEREAANPPTMGRGLPEVSPPDVNPHGVPELGYVRPIVAPESGVSHHPPSYSTAIANDVRGLAINGPILFDVIALFDRTTESAPDLDPEDLEFFEGERLAVLDDAHSGWWKAIHHDVTRRQPGRDLIPHNFFRKADLGILLPRSDVTPMPRFVEPLPPPLFHVKARFDYTPPLPSINNPCSDLAFKKGDILAITSTKSSDGWWEGHHVLTSKQHKQAYLPDGVRGYSVPSNFVSPTEWRALPFLYLAIANHDYEPGDPDQTIECSFKEGDVIAITMENSDGWHEGYVLNERRRLPGDRVVPSNFIRKIGGVLR